jgi:hypothetical protein
MTEGVFVSKTGALGVLTPPYLATSKVIVYAVLQWSESRVTETSISVTIESNDLVGVSQVSEAPVICATPMVRVSQVTLSVVYPTALYLAYLAILQGYAAPEGAISAYWHGGYFGIDTPRVFKMFRFGRIITDQVGFRVMNLLIDHVRSTFRKPKKIDFRKIDASRIPVNQKAKLNQYWIQFPDEDVDANVLELTDSHIPISER